MRIWRRKHRHSFEYHSVYSGAALVSQYGVCECGEETERMLTPAGAQQLGWWLAIFPEWDYAAVANGVKYGLLPHPFMWTGGQPDSLGRTLTRDEALAAIEEAA